MCESSSSPKSRFLTSFNDVRSEKQSAGRFVLATNVLDEAILDNSEIISEYKAQQLCERGFGFLKDPLFFTPLCISEVAGKKRRQFIPPIGGGMNCCTGLHKNERSGYFYSRATS